MTNTNSNTIRLAHWAAATPPLRAYQQADAPEPVVHVALLGDARTVCSIWMTAGWPRTQAAPSCRFCAGYLERHSEGDR